MNTAQPLARLGAVAFFVGAVLLISSTAMHPLDSDPANAPAAFAEYAADPHYVWTHIGQFAGFFGLGMGMVAFAATFEPGRAAAWARIGSAGAVASIAMAAALQAVDGVALKGMVDRLGGRHGGGSRTGFRGCICAASDRNWSGQLPERFIRLDTRRLRHRGSPE